MSIKEIYMSIMSWMDDVEMITEKCPIATPTVHLVSSNYGVQINETYTFKEKSERRI